MLAFLMFGMLDALRTSLSQAINLAGADRLMLHEQGQHHGVAAARVLRKGEGDAGRACGGAVQLVRRHLQGQQAADPGAGDGARSRSSRCTRNCKIKPEEFEAWKHDRQGIIVGPGAREPLRLEGRPAHSAALGHLAQGATAATPGSSTSSASTTSSGTGVDKAQRVLPLRLLQRVVAVRQGPWSAGW